MIKKYSLVFLIFLFASPSPFAQISESFSNSSAASGMHSDVTCTGDDDFEWSATDPIDDQTLTVETTTSGDGILRNLTAVPNEIGEISFDFKRFTTESTGGSMNTNQYKCIVPNSCGSIDSNSTSLSLSNPVPNNAINVRACFNDTKVSLTWNPPNTGPIPTGYVVFALEGSTPPSGGKSDASSYTADSNYTLASDVIPASLGRIVYKGNAINTTITGLTENNSYSFTVFSYVGEILTGWSSGGTAGSTITAGLAQSDIRNLTSTPSNNQITLNWNNPLPLSCWDELIIVANEGPVSFLPSGDGSSYMANDIYSTPNQVVYKGSASSKSVTGLTNFSNYCFRLFIRRGVEWSEGVEICASPFLNYCSSSGRGADGLLNLIRNVEFNSISNPTPNIDNGYYDFTSISTPVDIGNNYNLSVNVNAIGVGPTFTKVWIDWNNNGSFSDSGEDYDLGTAQGVADGATSNSPLNITIPISAKIGTTRMRVSTRNSLNPTPCMTDFEGEVEDYTLNIQKPTGAEINVRGAGISIPNGFSSPYGLNNTLFASTSVGSNSIEKLFIIENIGLSTLNLTGTPVVNLVGFDADQFVIVEQPSVTIISASNSVSFKVRFSPTSDGVKNTFVSIANDDTTESENPYIFAVRGTGTCSFSVTSSMWPLEGPINTEITFTSAQDLSGASAKINGISLPMVSNSSSELVLRVPAGATSGNIRLQLASGCTSTTAFQVINTMISGCDAIVTNTLADLIISEITDATSGSSSFIEVYNGTPNSIDLSDYNIKLFNNGSTSPTTTKILTGTLASGSIYVLSFGQSSCSFTNLNVSPDLEFPTVGGINFNTDSSDMLQLTKISTSTIIDSFGTFGSNSWSNGLGVGLNGVNFRRKNNAVQLPSSTFNLTDWNVIDWTSCADSDYQTIGQFDFSSGIPPTIALQPIAPNSDCDLTAAIKIEAIEGIAGGSTLSYQWYRLAPNQASWAPITDEGVYDNSNTDTLLILNTIELDGFQYYARVFEGNSNCFSATNSVKMDVNATEWNGINWSDGLPSLDRYVIINGDYNTSIGGAQTSFSACSVLVKTDSELIVANNTFIEILNNLTVYGHMIVNPKGSVVQIDDSGLVNGSVLSDKSKIIIEKETAPINAWYEYTYWSSPVIGELIGNALFQSNSDRRFSFNAANYRDSTMESNNNNATVVGQDDIDDDGNDWILASASEIMMPGVGYAATLSQIAFVGTARYKHFFEGPINNGIITVSVERNDLETADNNWNLLGNPYPSAIDVDLFLNQNLYSESNPTGTLDGAIYLWSQNAQPSETNNGNQKLNFSQSDYAIINGSAEIAGGDMEKPNRFIPSGQGFFISFSDSHSGTLGNVIFINSMRAKNPGTNDQFFRTSNIKEKKSEEKEKLWINLTSDTGVFNQICIAYLEGASDQYDGMYYDAPRNRSSKSASILYSIIPEEPKLKFAIQGRGLENLNYDETIQLGFSSSINSATLFELSVENLIGNFLTSQTIFLRDKELGLTHNLSKNPYSFTSTIGEYNDRFELFYNQQTLGTVIEDNPKSNLKIIELNEDQVLFSIDNETIKKIEIYDLLGRKIHLHYGNREKEYIQLSNIGPSSFIAKAHLDNGQIIVKKGIKRL